VKPIKVAVLADAHGIWPALEAILADLADFYPQHLVYAGDFTRGPFPNEVISRLRELGALMIRGNDDSGLLRFLDGQAPQTWRTSKQYGMLRWTAAALSADNAAFLRGLPEQCTLALPATGGLRVVHGSPVRDNETLSPENLARLDRVLAQVPEAGLVCAHSHVQWSLRRGRQLVVNPGAAAGTLIGPLAQYARLTWDGAAWQVEPRTLEYDITVVHQAFTGRGLLAAGGAMARGFLISLETGEDEMMRFLRYAEKMADDQGWEGEGIPDEIWSQAERLFAWQDY
jgi:predicted phosphodiesterase